MPDARGHGNSSAPTHGYSYEDHAFDVIGLIDALRLDSLVLVGHSMGGMTATVVAKRMPKGLRGLVLADPTFLTPQRQREVYESDVADQHRRMLARSKEALVAEMQSRHSHRSHEVIMRLAEARLQTSVSAFEVLTPPNPDYMQLIHTVDVPSLLIVGDAGSVVTLEMAAKLAVVNPHLEVVQIEQAGHGLPYDQPERFSAALQTFLRSMAIH